MQTVRSFVGMDVLRTYRHPARERVRLPHRSRSRLLSTHPRKKKGSRNKRKTPARIKATEAFPTTKPKKAAAAKKQAAA